MVWINAEWADFWSTGWEDGTILFPQNSNINIGTCRRDIFSKKLLQNLNRQHCRLSICSYFGWVWQILNLRRAGLSKSKERVSQTINSLNSWIGSFRFEQPVTPVFPPYPYPYPCLDISGVPKMALPVLKTKTQNHKIKNHIGNAFLPLDTVFFGRFIHIRNLPVYFPLNT